MYVQLPLIGCLLFMMLQLSPTASSSEVQKVSSIIALEVMSPTFAQFSSVPTYVWFWYVFNRLYIRCSWTDSIQNEVIRIVYRCPSNRDMVSAKIHFWCGYRNWVSCLHLSTMFFSIYHRMVITSDKYVHIWDYHTRVSEWNQSSSVPKNSLLAVLYVYKLTYL